MEIILTTETEEETTEAVEEETMPKVSEESEDIKDE